MEEELLNIFDAQGNLTGTASRTSAHQLGLWHETFHCWFVSKERGRKYVHFQLRSPDKKDFPNQLDITAAGHLSSDEDVNDGVREIKEELGIELTPDDLTYTGTVRDEIIIGNFIDKELCHVFLYNIPENTVPDYVFMDNEVSGVFKIELSAFEELWSEEADSITVNDIQISKTDFVPHENSYINAVIASIKQHT
ncbi:Isopentenyl-diphosphate Delta-isomerase [Jeotgalicoccus saudimassiliensis]|uniref:Isopentenyl-diphosphate Delta-isomerase n=1 Tax=Jeotgalicoccus saudimassiliensis TaxID=1461582 RepID=A0A078M9G6_9STAP|nr:NUDIX domain-containing protein [Jeotgalicoccus saudimassiliensis]CEA02062.1 Isopentenyl-diphosphate Delta-isomerase [Jeotgalicoccus saudimassiliensis]